MDKQFIVYSAKGCRDCELVKEYLKDNGVSFEVRDLMASREYQEEVEKFGFMGIPVTAVGDQAVKGFNPGELNRLIGLVK
ncbi:glutaredoxin family protein [Sutcliffiella rhizosphaerae]|uniref:Glutaredoxin-like protein NrdH n=1 Tax=Sutcliffiella rhizosphaerae TaxID=2880967 RepID=A0ABN8A752_9BACI|nr:glutaredoxin family protein [Sutcliffiella rhizosphaerae]CAG9620934.1 Glutaredoxin-like protein NrdH [Sutcliffiella rhizosphaerae]